ncbi:MAG: hypothetical protein IJB96_08835 [Lachnospira sp.]|nr:hypothetical protein [Lachnospira sp.]
MKKTLKRAIIITVMAMISVVALMPIFDSKAIDDSFIWVLGFYLSLITVPMMIVFWTVHIGESMNKRIISPFVLFGVLEGLLAIAFAIWGVYDIMTDEGWFAGLVGLVLLIYVVPFLVIAIIVDIIIARVINKRAKLQQR